MKAQPKATKGQGSAGPVMMRVPARISSREWIEMEDAVSRARGLLMLLADELVKEAEEENTEWLKRIAHGWSLLASKTGSDLDEKFSELHAACHPEAGTGDVAEN